MHVTRCCNTADGHGAARVQKRGLTEEDGLLGGGAVVIGGGGGGVRSGARRGEDVQEQAVLVLRRRATYGGQLALLRAPRAVDGGGLDSGPWGFGDGVLPATRKNGRFGVRDASEGGHAVAVHGTLDLPRGCGDGDGHSERGRGDGEHREEERVHPRVTALVARLDTRKCCSELNL